MDKNNMAAVAGISDRRFALPSLRIADGTLEALKWLGLLLMTGDHVNKYLLNDTVPALFDAGRAVMPIFVFVLAFNLARPGTLARGVYQRTIMRLAVFGALATPAFIALGGLLAGWWPLNILFTLLVLTATLFFIERGGNLNAMMAGAILVLGGSSVEFWWPAIILGMAVWFYARRPSATALVVAVLACAALAVINRNFWELAALPVIAAAARFDVRCPRWKWAFYAYYPAHLTVLWLIRIPMSHAGYLFFT
ncbi:conjugal transfer protein TraX [Xanthomonas oryzae pv. oryzicola]|uniref:TraX family protein n=1 Tax=Xanthomonas oryzae TaxID=347 RepID=UPI000654CDFD|nr:TraX family protein [Xanthomonas oryzae]AKK65884.1 conjugal transfer protein TraX [Xanthomonas oryzae pv. oryzicola]